MNRRRHEFIRVATDFSKYKSYNHVNATRVVIEKFLMNKFKLTINKEKRRISKSPNFTLLGFGFVPRSPKSTYKN